jgi:hypothetical protein
MEAAAKVIPIAGFPAAVTGRIKGFCSWNRARSRFRMVRAESAPLASISIMSIVFMAAPGYQ